MLNFVSTSTFVIYVWNSSGYWSLGTQPEATKNEIEKMVDALRHREPDDRGIWQNGRGLALGQTRLAIVDLKPTGHQPMVSEDGHYVLVFNGEIYNYKALAKMLTQDGCSCEATGDTRVLLQACSHWGVAKTLPRLNGMFAFGFYDCQEDLLLLARDRFGEKPLYYMSTGNTFAFASELKALARLSHFDKTIDTTALDLYLRLNYIPCPYSIYRDVEKLFPGHYLEVRAGKCTEKCYYDLAQVFKAREQITLPEAQIIQMLDEKLQKSVQERMVADVPVGAFLSGGIDSSLMVTLMQRQSRQPIKTFTVGFKNSCWDESGYAEAIAKHLGTDHTTVYIEPEELFAGAESIIDLYDEPFGDASALSTHCISKRFRSQVTVAIGGDGGDELFFGYHRHKWVPKLNSLARCTPSLLLSLAEKFNQRFLAVKRPIVAGKIQKGLRALHGRNFLEIYLNSVSYWPTPCSFDHTWFQPNKDIRNKVEQTAYLDLRTFLHDDVLCKVDRASMAVGLETRAPFLDYDLAAFAFQIPVKQRFTQGRKKHLLKSLLGKYLPQHLWDRPKMGFGMPLDQAIRTQLKTQYEVYLKMDSPLWAHSNQAAVQRCFAEHLSGKMNHELLLWNFFVAQQFFAKKLY